MKIAFERYIWGHFYLKESSPNFEILEPNIVSNKRPVDFMQTWNETNNH
jgi:hypothetical protein